MYLLRQLRKFNLPEDLLNQFYSAIMESVLCTLITVWFSSATKSDLRRLRRVVRTTERIIGTTLPTVQELYLSRVSKRAGKITLDPSHLAHFLFELLLSGRRYRALSTRTTRHRNSFFPQAIHLMNTWHEMWNTQHYTILQCFPNLSCRLFARWELNLSRSVLKRRWYLHFALWSSEARFAYNRRTKALQIYNLL